MITSYQTLARDLPLLRTIAWTTVVFDEAQALKNPDTQLRAAAVALAVRSRFAVTGTPIENPSKSPTPVASAHMPGVRRFHHT